MGTVETCCKAKSTKTGKLTFEKLYNLKFIKNIATDRNIYTSSLFYKNQKPDFDQEDFSDIIFPAVSETICLCDHPNNPEIHQTVINQFKELTFERPRNMFKEGKYKLWDKIEINDVHQGQLENSYFLSAVCAIAEFPERFNKIFLNNEVNKNGCHAVNFFIQGKPKIVTLDDYFPCHSNKTFAFSYSGPGEIWVQLLEKAWAKINLSYANTIGGIPSEALSALTNAPVITVDFKKYKDTQQIWSLLKENDNKDYIICSNCIPSAEAETVGLIASNSYGILSAKEYKDVRLLKLMNPWGAYEWKGDFSDGSGVWTEELRNAFGMVSANDGMFYMKFEDFIKFFKVAYICKYEKNYHYDCKKFVQNPQNNMVCAKIEIKKTSKIIIGLHQKQKRFYRKVKNYNSQFGRIILAKYNSESGYKYIGSHCGDTEKIFLETEINETGEYHIFSYVNWPYHNEDSCSYVISTYAEQKVEIEALNDVSEDYLKQIFSTFLLKRGKLQKLTDDNSLEMSYSIDENDLGYYLVMIRNNSDSDMAKFSMEVTYEKDKIRFISNQLLSSLNQYRIDNGNSVGYQGNLTVMILPNSVEFIVFELNDAVKNSPLKLEKMEYYFFKLERNKSPVSTILIRNMYKIKKNKINQELDYFEISDDEYVYIVFVNNSQNLYNLKNNFPILENLVNENKTEIINLLPYQFNFLKLRKRPNSGNNNSFSLICSFRKL